MTLRFFDRCARLTLSRAMKGTFGDPNTNGLEIEDLRIQFQITKALSSTPNTCEVSVTNLREDTRNAINHKPLWVKLDAGHDGVYRNIFVGDLRYGQSRREGTEIITTLQLADGDRAYRAARLTKAYKTGTSVYTVLKDAARSMGLVVPPDLEVTAELKQQAAGGERLNGRTRDELTRLLAPYGYHWSMQDGKLVVVKDRTTAPNQALLINQAAGMIGSPELGSPDKQGNAPSWTIKTLLYPEAIPGRLLRVETRDVTGDFKAVKVTHKGDTHGADWTTEIEAKHL